MVAYVSNKIPKGRNWSPTKKNCAGTLTMHEGGESCTIHYDDGRESKILRRFGKGAFGMVFIDPTSLTIVKIPLVENPYDETGQLRSGGPFATEVCSLKTLYPGRTAVLNVEGDRAAQGTRLYFCRYAFLMPYVPSVMESIWGFFDKNKTISLHRLVGILKNLVETYGRTMSHLSASFGAPAVHSDLSLLNCVMSPDGKVITIIDFGSAGAAGDPSRRYWDTHYLWSDESRHPKAKKNPADDVYALSVMILQLILNRLMHCVASNPHVSSEQNSLKRRFMHAACSADLLAAVRSILSHLAEHQVTYPPSMTQLLAFLTAQIESPLSERVTATGLAYNLALFQVSLRVSERGPGMFQPGTNAQATRASSPGSAHDGAENTRSMIGAR